MTIVGEVVSAGGEASPPPQAERIRVAASARALRGGRSGGAVMVGTSWVKKGFRLSGQTVSEGFESGFKTA
jgi:hypothetical protein